MVAPVVTLVKVTLPGLAVSSACTPEPLRATVEVWPWAFTMETEPLREFAVDGLYCRLKVALCCGARVKGVLMPEAETFEPLTPICVIEVLELPVLVMVSVWLAELPTFTCPKETDEGLTESVVVAATPVPLRATEAGELGALLAMESAPVTLPADCGAY